MSKNLIDPENDIINSGKGLISLLPITPSIEKSAFEMGKKTGEIIDSLAGPGVFYEWEGYLLAELSDLMHYVDIEFQDNQFLLSDTVLYRGADFDRTLERIRMRNEFEERARTERELVPVGLIHRHGFTEELPQKSPKDINNIFNYIKWLSIFVNSHSEKKMPFINFASPSDGKSDKKNQFVLYGNRLVLLQQDYDNLILDISGVKQEDLIKVRGILNSAKINACQNFYYTVSPQLILNRNGGYYFEVLILAQGAIKNSLNHPFEVPLQIVETGKGISRSDNELERIILDRMDWPYKQFYSIPFYSFPNGETVQGTGFMLPSFLLSFSGTKNIHLEESGSGLSEYKKAEIFYHMACVYLSSTKLPGTDYSHFLYAFLNNLLSSSVEESISSLPKLRKNQFVDGKIFIPPTDMLEKDKIIHAITNYEGFFKGFFHEFKGNNRALTGIIEKYFNENNFGEANARH